MSSTSRRTYDTDMLTVRQIFAFNPNESFISSGLVLASMGNGETSWVEASSLVVNPAFNRVIANGSSIVADASYNTFVLSTLDGLGMDVNTGSKQVYLYNKGFTRLDISGGNSIYGYSHNTVTPTVKFVGQSGINIVSDPTTNTIRFQGIPTEIATGLYAYNQVKVISNANVINTNLPGDVLTAPSVTSRLNIIGLNDILLSTNVTSNAFTINISSFTSAEYLQISTLANTNISTVSTLFYDIPRTGQATSSLLDFTSNVSVGIQTRINYDATYFTTFYTTLDYFSNVSTSTSGKINSKINFISSIGAPEQGLPQTGVDDSGVFQFSSATFNLNSMNSNIQLGANLEVRENLSIVLDSNITGDKNNIYTISTFITVDDVFLPSTVFTRPWMAPNDAGPNLLTDTIFMSLDPNTMIVNPNSTYKILHRINNYNLTSYTVSNVTSVKNGVSLRFWKA
jgi:hypothetical protein